MVEGFFYGT